MPSRALAPLTCDAMPFGYRALRGLVHPHGVGSSRSYNITGQSAVAVAVAVAVMLWPLILRAVELAEHRRAKGRKGAHV